MKKEDVILYKAIDDILWFDWDPIGVNDNEEIRDEYQGYTPQIFKLKKDGADVNKITKHIYQLEIVSMGMTGNKERCKIIAEKIINL